MTLGIASWRGAGVLFTDGMCAGCAARFRRQSSLPEPPTIVSAASRLRFVPAAAALVVVTGLLLAGRSLDDGRAPVMAAAPPPSETVLVPTPVDEPPAPPPSRPRAPRRLAAAKASSPVPSPAVARAPAADTPSEPVIVVSSDPLFDADLIRLVSFSEPERRPFSAASTFAALPHAGITQQTP